MILFAYAESIRDDDKIDDHEEIKHGERLKFRLLVCGILFAIAGFFDWYFHRDFGFLLLIPMGWACWTASFRLLLNTIRGKGWRYVNVGNRYDEWWLARAWHQPASANQIRNRAGTMAYAFECAIFIASFWGWAVERINN